MTRFTGVTRLSAIFAVVAVAACSRKSETQQDTAMTPSDTAVAPSATASTTPAATSSTASTAIVPININTASDAEILRIPGVGPRMLREFKEYRPYTSIEQFRREIGKYVDKAEVARLEQYIVIK